MKINPSYRPSTEPGNVRPSGPTAPGNAPAAAPASGASAQVELSAASAALQSSSDDVNLERVHALREAIRQGQLSYDTSKIADGLLESARELLQADSAKQR